MIVDLVKTRSSDGVTLDGALRAPPSGTASSLPVDCVIMHHGIGGNFYREHFHDEMTEAFLERGTAVMRVNSRGHDLAYNCPPPHNRLGAAYETVDDCRLDWKAWIDLAEERGFGRIAIWGHSLGAVKSIYYMAKEKDARIQRAITSSPPRFSHSAYQSHPGAELFNSSAELARRLAGEGKMDELFAIEAPTAALMTTRTFLDKYGPEERYDILELLPDVSTPLLITIGGAEGRPDQRDRFAFGGLADELTARSASEGNFAFHLIEGGDHFYTGVTAQLWATVEQWLSGD